SINCLPGVSNIVKIPFFKVPDARSSAEYWLRVSFHTLTNSDWAPADQEIAWQQMKLEVKKPMAPVVKPAVLPELTIVQRDDVVKVGNEHFTVSFSRYTGAP